MRTMTHYRFWVQSVLPLVYDDSLSYYEVLAKCVDYINNLIDNDNEMLASMEDMRGAIEELRQMVEDAGITDIDELIERVGVLEGKTETLEAKTANLPNYETNNPTMNGTASAGISTKYSRGDHVHPTDTSRASTESVNNVKNMISNKSLLVNGYFVGGGSQLGDGVFPINQRGQTSYTNAGNCIDRWALGAGASLDVNTDGITFTRTASTGYPVLEQVLASPIPARQKIHFSAIIKTNFGRVGNQILVRAVYSDGGTPGLVTISQQYDEWTLIEGTLATTLPVTAFRFQFSNPVSTSDVGDYLKIMAIKLELGEAQTLTHQEDGNLVLNELPNYGEELLKCQRYFQMFRTEALRPTYAIDCRPVMAGEPTPSTLTIADVTYYTLTV